MTVKLDPTIKNWMTLSKELKVACVICRLRNLRDPVDVSYFSNIVKHIQKIDDLSITDIHNAIDNLIDTGTINAQWTKVDNKWVREFFIDGYSKELIEKLTREVYNY